MKTDRLLAAKLALILLPVLLTFGTCGQTRVDFCILCYGFEFGIAEGISS